MSSVHISQQTETFALCSINRLVLYIRGVEPSLCSTH